MVSWILTTFVILGMSVQVLAAPKTVQMTPREAIYFYAHQGNVAALQKLKQSGHPIDLSDKYGNSALCEAVLRQDKIAIQTLIQQGADTNAYCMQAISANNNINTVPSTPYQSTPAPNGQTPQNVLASKEETKIPNPPKKWSTDAKVFTGLGVTAAVVGGGVALALSGGGGSKTSCVMGTMTDGHCVCNEGVEGSSCDKCKVGYDFHHTRSCHVNKVCKTNAHQVGDNCVCNEGFSFEGESACFQDLRCNLYANMEQSAQTGECVCTDSNYKHYPLGCFEEKECPAHSSQQNSICVCNADYPKATLDDKGSAVSCATCGTNKEWNGTECVCDAAHPVRTDTGSDFTCTACPEHAKWSGAGCYCDSSSSWPVQEVDSSGKVIACYQRLDCHGHGTQSGNKCTCNGHWDPDKNCGECKNGFSEYDGDCISEVTSAQNEQNNNNRSISITNTSSNPVKALFYSGMLTAANPNGGNTYSLINIENSGTGDVYGIYGKDETTNTVGNIYGAYHGTDKYKSVSKIKITNTNEISKSYGMYGFNDVYAAYKDVIRGGSASSDIEIKGNGDIYGLTSEGENARIIGAYNASDEYVTDCSGKACTKSNITIINDGGNSHGIHATGYDPNHLDKNWGSVYGVWDTGDAGSRSVYSGITMYQKGGTAYGMYGKNIYSSEDYAKLLDDVIESEINISLVGSVQDDVATGTAYGLYAPKGPKKTGSSGPLKENEIFNTKTGAIHIDYIGGKYRTLVDGDDYLSPEVSSVTDNTAVYGIYAQGNVNVTNAGNIVITRPYSGTFRTNVWSEDKKYVSYYPTNSAAGKAYGIYIQDNAGSSTDGTGIINEIVNSGTIKIKGHFKEAYGIYVTENALVNVVNDRHGLIEINTGTDSEQIAYAVYMERSTHSGNTFRNEGKIIVNDNSCTGDDCNSASFINLNNNIFKNSGGSVSTSSLNLNSFGGTVIGAKGSSFVASNSISGTLHIDPDTVISGFGTTYREQGMIQAGDTSKLRLVSDSALFDASLDGNDVVMTMKGFDTATKNKSLSSFLTKNYALGNNETFYNKLKSFGDMNDLTDSLNKLTGKDMLSRLNFEDMTMMRELNFDMNEKLFHNKEQHFALAGSVSPMAFRGDTGSNARYSLYNKRDGNTSIGLGVAFTNVHSDDAHDKDNRSETSYQLILPMGYKTAGFNLVTSPRIGYARGTYDRTGFDEKTYDGTIEKRVFGLMNEARYPITVGKWKLEPSAEFNILGYQQKGHEDAKEFALNIQNQNTYSVEGGIGLYATREEELDKDSTLKLTAGVAAYHEFADPYRIKVGMDGMDGAFTLHDENRSENRGVIRAGFDYTYRDLSLYGSLISYIDREARTSAKTGMKVKF